MQGNSLRNGTLPEADSEPLPGAGSHSLSLEGTESRQAVCCFLDHLRNINESNDLLSVLCFWPVSQAWFQTHSMRWSRSPFVIFRVPSLCSQVRKHKGCRGTGVNIELQQSVGLTLWLYPFYSFFCPDKQIPVINYEMRKPRVAFMSIFHRKISCNLYESFLSRFRGRIELWSREKLN